MNKLLIFSFVQYLPFYGDFCEVGVGVEGGGNCGCGIFVLLQYGIPNNTTINILIQ